jgi:hypothetical protein
MQAITIQKSLTNRAACSAFKARSALEGEVRAPKSRRVVGWTWSIAERDGVLQQCSPRWAKPIHLLYGRKDHPARAGWVADSTVRVIASRGRRFLRVGAP